MTNKYTKCYDYGNQQWHYLAEFKCDIFENVGWHFSTYNQYSLLMQNGDARQESIARAYADTL